MTIYADGDYDLVTEEVVPDQPLKGFEINEEERLNTATKIVINGSSKTMKAYNYENTLISTEEIEPLDISDLVEAIQSGKKVHNEAALSEIFFDQSHAMNKEQIRTFVKENLASNNQSANNAQSRNGDNIIVIEQYLTDEHSNPGDKIKIIVDTTDYTVLGNTVYSANENLTIGSVYLYDDSDGKKELAGTFTTYPQTLPSGINAYVEENTTIDMDIEVY